MIQPSGTRLVLLLEMERKKIEHHVLIQHFQNYGHKGGVQIGSVTLDVQVFHLRIEFVKFHP